MTKLIDRLEKKVNDAGEALDETLRDATDNIKSRVSGMAARVDSYFEDRERNERQRRRDSRNGLSAVKVKP